MNIDSITSVPKKNNYIELFLPFYYLLAQYSWTIFSLGNLGLLLISLFQLFNQKGKVYINNYQQQYIYLLIYVVAKSIINAAVGPDNVVTAINASVQNILNMALVLVVCNHSIDENRLYSTWKFAGFVYGLGLIYQVVLIALGEGVEPISIIPGYELRGDNIATLRPSSFFAEPAAFVITMLPLLFLSLKRLDYKVATVTTILIFLSTSTSGIIISAILWMSSIWFLNIAKSRKITLLVLFSSIIMITISSEYFDLTVKKFLESIEGGSTVSSRIINGFSIIHKMNFFELFFGSFYNSSDTFVHDHIEEFSSNSSVLRYYYKGNVFVNSFCSILLGYGVVGLILHFNTFKSALLSKHSEVRLLSFVFVIALLGQSVFFNAYYFQFIMIIMLYENKKLFQSDSVLVNQVK